MQNYKLKILSLLFCFTISSGFAQSFKPDWKNFKAPLNWKVTFTPTGKLLFDKKSQGELIFENEIDTNLKITFDAFLDFQLDSAFHKKLKDFTFIQSCLSTYNFTAFNYKNVYYLPKPCNNCALSIVGSRPINAKNTAGKQMNNCELLATEIAKFTNLQQH